MIDPPGSNAPGRRQAGPGCQPRARRSQGRGASLDSPRAWPGRAHEQPARERSRAARCRGGRRAAMRQPTGGDAAGAQTGRGSARTAAWQGRVAHPQHGRAAARRGKAAAGGRCRRGAPAEGEMGR
jgi:hypothetical protein